MRKIILNNLSVADRKHILEKLSKDYNGIIKGKEKKIFEEFIANVLSEMDYEYASEFRELAKAYWKNDEKFIDNFKVSEYNNIMDAGGENSHVLDILAFGDNDNTSLPVYTDEEYRTYGWARENNLLNAGQNADYRSKFAAALNGMAKFNKSENGEYIIPVSDIYDPIFEGVNNVLVFAKGTIDKPIITSIIEICKYDETEIDRIRRQIYDSERRGIQQKTGKLFGRYFASDFEFQPNQQRNGSESIGNSGDNGYGRRSPDKIERTDARTPQISSVNNADFGESKNADAKGERRIPAEKTGKITKYSFDSAESDTQELTPERKKEIFEQFEKDRAGVDKPTQKQL